MNIYSVRVSSAADRSGCVTEGQLGGHFGLGCVADLFHCGSEQGRGSRGRLVAVGHLLSLFGRTGMEGGPVGPVDTEKETSM